MGTGSVFGKQPWKNRVSRSLIGVSGVVVGKSMGMKTGCSCCAFGGGESCSSGVLVVVVGADAPALLAESRFGASVATNMTEKSVGTTRGLSFWGTKKYHR